MPMSRRNFWHFRKGNFRSTTGTPQNIYSCKDREHTDYFRIRRKWYGLAFYVLSLYAQLLRETSFASQINRAYWKSFNLSIINIFRAKVHAEMHGVLDNSRENRTSQLFKPIDHFVSQKHTIYFTGCNSQYDQHSFILPVRTWCTSDFFSKP